VSTETGAWLGSTFRELTTLRNNARALAAATIPASRSPTATMCSGTPTRTAGANPDIAFTEARGELLGEAGGGLAAAQRVLGPARMLHSMRLVGTAERALELMTGRLRSREVRGRPLADNDLWIDRVGGAAPTAFPPPGILADLYAHARSLRISDGPDEVHRRMVGRHELALNHAADGAVPPASRSRAAPRTG